jgi:SAM-dependent methyltransferase
VSTTSAFWGDRAARIENLGYNYATQPKVRVTRCNLCRWGGFVILAHKDRYGYPAKTCGCLNCGLVFLNPVMTAEAYADFYRDTYRPLLGAFQAREITAEILAGEDRKRVYAEALIELLEPEMAKCNAHNLLDIGGSVGVTADHLSEAFELEATVLDPSPEEIALAKRRVLKTIIDFIEEHQPNDQYDLITMCQTIDHLQDPAAALAKIHQMLNLDGLFFMDIVDFRAKYRHNGSIEAATKIDHPYCFTQESATIYLERAGFEILTINYAPDRLHIGFLCRRGDPEPHAWPLTSEVRAQWREIRSIQNMVLPLAGEG